MSAVALLGRGRALVERRALPGARRDRLFYAQVHEDPVLDIEVVAPGQAETIVVVSSGGCTALSLLAAGAGRVVAVDLNATQNDLVELKYAAVRLLSGSDALAFLGGTPAPPQRRREWYAALRHALSAGARAYWDGRDAAIARGVLGSGVSERFMGLLARVVRVSVHPPRRIHRLLACGSIAEQRDLYSREWNNRRWRLMYHLLLSRRVFNRAYDPAFFRHVENPSFARHFHALAGRTLTTLPVATNYFLHYALTDRYPVEIEDGVPPYLSEAGTDTIAAGRAGTLELVDANLSDYLATLPEASVDGFVLSNIAEWLDGDGLDALFAAVARTAAPGARVCFRNFVGWTEVPVRWRDVIVEDREYGEALILRDRSMVNRRIAACRVWKETER